jgi:hypothetical protein
VERRFLRRLGNEPRERECWNYIHECPVARFREVASAVERWAVNRRRAINSKNSGIGAY